MVCGRGCGVKDHPGNAEREQARVADGIGFGGEVGLGFRALLPLGGERGGDGRLAAVLGEVGQGAAEGDGAEGLGVFTVLVDILGVEGEEGIGWGIVAGPEKGADPGVGILLREPGELEVVGGGEGLALDVEHGGGESHDEDDG